MPVAVRVAFLLQPWNDLLTEGEVATGVTQNAELLLEVLGGGADSGVTDLL